ncbi:MAG: menaquinone biosynthesis decarboxylase [Candidatus Dormibacteria bacterium]
MSAPADLREFISALEAKGELKRIPVEVSQDLEVTEVTDRCSKDPALNRALLFEKVRGQSAPILINAFGSMERMAIALGDPVESIADRLGSTIETELPVGLGDKIRKLGELSELVRFMPRTVKRAPSQEVVHQGDEVDLGRMPILKCWPDDGGRYITLPLVTTNHPVTGKRNLGMYRLQQFDRNTLGMHWQIHKGGAEHSRLAEATATRIPVSVSLGGPPVCVYAATAPLPPDLDELMFAGWLARCSVETVRCVTQPVEALAGAEYVIEGYVDPSEKRTEGPFGDHTGYYSLADGYPVLHVTAITHRKDPIYPATIVGMPPMEDWAIGKTTERIFLRLFQMVHSEVVDFDLPVEGVFANCVIISFRKKYPGHAHKIISAAWSTLQLSLTKFVIAVDHDCDVHDYRDVAFRALSNVDPTRDLTIAKGPLDVLDHSADHFAFGGKCGVDATRKWNSEGFLREWPPDIVMSDEVQALVSARWAEYGL